MDIKLHLLLQSPPPGVDFGIQKGSGSSFETILVQRSEGGDLAFDLVISLKKDSQKLSEPRFTGPFIQGKPGEQFLYIGIGEFAGQTGGWNRRIKIPFSGITWEMIRQLEEHSVALLETRIQGTAKDGTPTCGTVKPFEGWRVGVVSGKENF